jgi:hypothetical protein
MAGWLAGEISIWGIHLQNWMLVVIVIVALWIVYLGMKAR